MKGKYTQTIKYATRKYPRRLSRLAAHLFFLDYRYYSKSNSTFDWILELGFYILDIVLIPDLYEIFNLLVDGRIRLLLAKEVRLATEYFGKSIELSVVKINTNMSIAVRKKALAYVSMNTINYSATISRAIFLHELVHIYQYQK